MRYEIETRTKKRIADTVTPVTVYGRLRDVFAGSILLESTDYRGRENARSFICCKPIASFGVFPDRIESQYPGGAKITESLLIGDHLVEAFEQFRKSFHFVNGEKSGLFGYMAYDAVRHFEEIDITGTSKGIPDMLYKLYQLTIIIDHFSNEMTLIENSLPGMESQIEWLEEVVMGGRLATHPFAADGEEQSLTSDTEFLEMVESGRRHCHLGDVFQIVLSRRYQQKFRGDEFNVYRALRSINPSPYLFYFDYDNFKLFGSSPEAQLQIRNGHASVHPIAGTFKRSGSEKEDALIAEKLLVDEKENAEHLMLVDLARNDLSRSGTEVSVEMYREVQYYSHVIHMVSRVGGRLNGNDGVLKVISETFPAGTLSGAPKRRAMELINHYEPVNRGFYGGAIGFFGFNGDCTHAIMIRTFMSMSNTLIYQAGAGVVAQSDSQKELQEVANKLGALRAAIRQAELDS